MTFTPNDIEWQTGLTNSKYTGFLIVILYKNRDIYVITDDNSKNNISDIYP